MIEEVLAALGLSKEETRIYFHLLEKGSSTAGNLANKLGLPRPTLYDTLQRMHGKGVVTRTLKSGIRTFGAETPRTVSQLFQQRIEKLQNQHKEFQEMLPMLEKKTGGKMLTPRFQIYEGVEGVQNVLKDMLLYRNTETFAFWPIRSMIDILSPDFFRWHNKERIRNNLYTRAIWPEKEVVKIRNHPYLGVGEVYRREIRVAPTDIHFTMGYWAYGDKAAFLSSQRESFGFVIESAELVQMLKVKFDVIWNISKRLLVDPKDMKPFIESL